MLETKSMRPLSSEETDTQSAEDRDWAISPGHQQDKAEPLQTRNSRAESVTLALRLSLASMILVVYV